MKVIKKLKKTVLLEDETGFRFFIPKEVFEEEDESLYDEAMIPHSLSFDLILQELVDAFEIQERFYAQGIHTLEDVLNNRKLVNDILKQHLSANIIIKAVKGG